MDRKNNINCTGSGSLAQTQVALQLLDGALAEGQGRGGGRGGGGGNEACLGEHPAGTQLRGGWWGAGELYVFWLSGCDRPPWSIVEAPLCSF